MSWRFMFVVLLLAAGASTWGGLHLGDWLVAHGPVAATVPGQSQVAAVPVLDSNGHPYVAQPPQPLVDGRLAVPEPLPPVAWAIPDKSLTEAPPNPTVDLATTTITMDEAKQIAASGAGQPLVGIADVGGLGLGSGSGNGQQPVQPIQPIQPIEAPPPPPNTPPANTSGAWQASLRQEIQACSTQGFFDRPSCAWAARNKYCEPNNAWGKVRDCPAKSF